MPQSPNASTQRIYPDEPEIACHDPTPARCILHIRRIDRLEHRMDMQEGRMTEVEKLHSVLQCLASDVRVLSERVKLMLWIGGAIALAIVGVLVTAFFKLILGG